MQWEIWWLLAVGVVIPSVFTIGIDHEDGRNAGMMVMVGLYTIYKAVVGGQVWLSMTCAMFGIWIVLSLLWSETRKSRMEVGVWVCYLVMLTAAQNLGSIVPMVVVAVGATWISLKQLWHHIKGDFHHNNSVYMGNSNHNATVLVWGMVSAVWMMEGVNPWWIVSVGVIATTIVGSRCRSGVLSLGLIIYYLVVCRYGILHWVSLGMVWMAVGCISYFILHSNRIESDIDTRQVLWCAALNLIKKSPIWGHGLNSYRMLLPGEVERMRKVENSNHTSHRVHNDWLEIGVELGLVGTLLFSALIWGMVKPETTPLLLGLTIMGSFFFPLREVHTAVPFWIVLGSMSGRMGQLVTWRWETQVVAIGLASWLIVVGVKKILALAYAEKGGEENLETALRYDPWNSTFMATLSEVTENKRKAWWMAMRVWDRYDGDLVRGWVKWRYKKTEQEYWRDGHASEK